MPLKFYEATYNATTNEVTLTLISKEDQDDNRQRPDFLVRHAVHEELSRVTVSNGVHEELVLYDVTLEQAVILFATVLGLRDAADEG